MATTAERLSEYAVCTSSNIYVELRDREEKRQTTGSELIAKYEQLVRIHTGILTYLDDLQAEHKACYDRNPEGTSHVFRVIGEVSCVIGDMPGWRLPFDTSLDRGVSYAIGADGSLYTTYTLSSFQDPSQEEWHRITEKFTSRLSSLSRDSYFQLNDTILMTYKIGRLEQLADAIEAYIAKSPRKILALMTTRAERLLAETRAVQP